MSSKANDLVQETIIEGSKLGARLFRNNVGLGWVGGIIRITKEIKMNLRPGDMVIRSARALHAGLCEGSSDAVGFTPVLITQDMVGKTVPIFTAIESKTGKGQLSQMQKSFIDMVLAFGGIAGVARSKQDLIDLIKPHIVPDAKFIISNKFLPVPSCKHNLGIGLCNDLNCCAADEISITYGKSLFRRSVAIL